VGVDGVAGAISTQESGLIVRGVAFTALEVIPTPALSLRLPLLIRHCCSTLTGTVAGTVTVCLLLLVRLLCSAVLCIYAPCSSLLICQQAHPSTFRCRDSDIITHSMSCRVRKRQEEGGRTKRRGEQRGRSSVRLRAWQDSTVTQSTGVRR
jgi:hypothetical protein